MADEKLKERSRVSSNINRFLLSEGSVSPKDEWMLFAFVFVFAFVVRLFYLGEMMGTPLFQVLMADSRVYDKWAQGIAGGDWFGKEVFYQAPFYPYFLGVVYKIFGP